MRDAPERTIPVRYRRKEVGTVVESVPGYGGHYVVIKITDPAVIRLLKGGAADFEVKV